MTNFDDRKRYTNTKIGHLRSSTYLADLSDFDDTAVCLTGSYGRLEASDRSDIDAFLISRDIEPIINEQKSQNIYTRILDSKLSNVDAIRLKAKIIDACRVIGVTKFDGDGRYQLTIRSQN